MKKGIAALFLFILVFVCTELFTFSSATNEPADKARPDTSGSKKNYYISAIELPADLNFAGEKIPLDLFDIHERMDKELLINTYWQSQTLLLLKRASRWFPLIEPILKSNNVPDDFKYLAVAESGLQNVVSPAKASGYWQFLSAAGKKYGLEISDEVDERYHIEKATEAACRYLLDANKELGSWTLAAAAYNMGTEGVKKQLEKQRVKNYYDLLLNEETSRYIFRLVALKEIFFHPALYGYHLRKKDLYPAIPFTTVMVDSSVSNLVDFAGANNITFKTLKLFNPWLRQNTLTNPSRKEYFIKIPDPRFDYGDFLRNGMANVDSVN